MTKNNAKIENPRAFPRTSDCISHENKDWDLDGMTLRDYFAGQALIGILTSGHDQTRELSERAATYAYDYADAMLKKRFEENK